MLAPVAGSVADVWSGASYERIAATSAPIHDRVVAELAIEPGERVLDVACGTGAVALRVARLGADVVGTDISGDQLAKAGLAAKDHERAAAELARVCRTGGRLALTAWPDDGWSQAHARAGWEASHDREARRWSEEAHARLEFLAPAVLRREYVLVLGRRR